MLDLKPKYTWIHPEHRSEEDKTPERERPGLLFHKANAHTVLDARIQEAAIIKAEQAELRKSQEERRKNGVEVDEKNETPAISLERLELYLSVCLAHVKECQAIGIDGERARWEDEWLEERGTSKREILLQLGSHELGFYWLADLYQCIIHGLTPEQKKAWNSFVLQRLETKSKDDADAPSVEERSPSLEKSTDEEQP